MIIYRVILMYNEKDEINEENDDDEETRNEE